MHRTQISLEPEQYRRLGDEARSRGISLAALIRDLIDDHLGRSQMPEDDPLGLDRNSVHHVTSATGRRASAPAPTLERGSQSPERGRPYDRRHPLEGLIGIGEGTGEAVGRDHNRHLYGSPDQ